MRNWVTKIQLNFPHVSGSTSFIYPSTIKLEKKVDDFKLREALWVTRNLLRRDREDISSTWKGASVLNEVEFCLRIIGIYRPQNDTMTSHFRDTQAKPGYVEIESKETPTQIYQYLLCKVITHFRGTLVQYWSHIQPLTKEKQTFCEALKDHQ